MRILNAIALAAAIASTTAPAAQAGFFSPATYVEGTVAAVDLTALTVDVGGTTYVAPSLSAIDQLAIGAPVRVSFVNQNGRHVAMAIDPVGHERLTAIPRGAHPAAR